MTNTRFAIVCLGRTGSTLLGQLLNSHPAIECGQELFRPGDGLYRQFEHVPRRHFLECHARETELPIFGFKMPFDWLIYHPGVIDDFRALGFQVVRLDRLNELNHFVSVKLAHLNSDWTSTTVYPVQTLAVDPAEFMTWLGYRATATRTLNAMCQGLTTHEIAYERILMTDAQTELLEFLGAESHPLSSPTMKARSLPVWDAITNYSELYEFFRPTQYCSAVPAPPEQRAAS
jgi:hypothetical protein